MAEDKREIGKLLAAADEAWRDNGCAGVGPIALMAEEWTADSEDKDEFFVLNSMTVTGRDVPDGKHYFYIHPVILSRDARGRPEVSGVVVPLDVDPDDGAVVLTFREIRDAPKPN